MVVSFLKGAYSLKGPQSFEAIVVAIPEYDYRSNCRLKRRRNTTYEISRETKCSVSPCPCPCYHPRVVDCDIGNLQSTLTLFRNY